ncbi:YqjF family protein [Flavobacterium ardleyense]|uniref:YqjF family protein n=1 Tax=Flavobacterium ardleyense TaxID=2038737 RepID=A0ABW5Z3N8_9FLAO
MKILNFINLTILSLLLLSGVISLFDDSFYLFTMLIALAILPVFQLFTGFVWLFKSEEDTRIKNYFYFTVSYLLLLFTAQFWYDAVEKIAILKTLTTAIFIIIPISLAVYFTVILYQFSKTRSFLNAYWKNLALINYEVDPSILNKYVPQGTEIDFYNEKCYVSLVGFLFKETKLLGLKIPFHVNFEEVNLRFYVKRFENNQWKRGVVFIKEIVPKHSLTFVANTIYKEHYQTLPMKHSLERTDTSIEIAYEWKMDKKWNSIKLQCNNEILQIEENSEAEFICEHYFGYSKYNDDTTFEYEVKHPRWEQYEVKEVIVDVDFNALYGIEFANLQNATPCSVILAKGSKVSVENKRKLN